MERLDSLKTELFSGFHEKKTWWGEELTIFERDGLEALPLIIRKAVAFEKVCTQMPIEIKDRELIVGVATMSSVAFGATFPKYETDDEAAYFAQMCLSRKSVWGHHLPYYPIVLNKGYNMLIAEIDEGLAEANKEKEERDFLKAARYTLCVAANVSRRYELLAEELAAKECDVARKVELYELADICRKVPMQPAKTFHEALQSIWFVHLVLHSTLSNTPLGRIDQYLQPFYERDIANGTLTKDRARELIGCFLIKFNERTQFNKEHMDNHLTGFDRSQGADANGSGAFFTLDNDQEYNFGQSANHWLQSITLSGVDENGTDKTNELSYMFIEMSNQLELASPMINARLHKKTPQEFLDFIGDALCDGGAQPVILNDDVIIKGLIEHSHITPCDAYDYATDGCWEILIPGRTEFTFGSVQLLHCIESLINGGATLMGNLKIGKEYKDLDRTFDTFEKFYASFFEQVKSVMGELVRQKIRYYNEVHKIAPEPFLSCFVKDCIEKARDMTNRGARYRIYGLLAVGMSHTVDSLCTLKTLVYDTKMTTLSEMAKAVSQNWEGYDSLRLMALNRTPKYGNQHPESDTMLKRVVSDYCSHVEFLNESYDWITLSPSIATFENYPTYGYGTGASFDGRLAREALSSNYSPSVGQDKEGPTAVLLSSAQPDLSRVTVGCPIDMRISFSKEIRADNANLLSTLAKTFVQIGGNILTLSKVDTETLKKAQNDPDKYQSLRVRLGGLTAYFVQLSKPQQDEYMRRVEHRL